MLCGDIRRPDGSIIRISPEEKLRCGVGFEKFRDASSRLTFGWTTQLPYPTCTSPSPRSCLTGGQRIYFEVFTEVGTRRTGLDVWRREWNKQLCLQCATAARTAHAGGRQKVWDSIPEFFGLSPWEELTNFV